MIAGDVTLRRQAEEVLLKAGALQRAIFNSANFSSIATDAKGVIQIFNVGAERMLGYTAAEASADGSTAVYIGPSQPAGIKRGSWIQTMPGKGWWVILRLYSPLEPFFTKQWRLSEIELVK